jgi:hypothetical protein
MDREEMVQLLVDSDIDYIMEDAAQDDFSMLAAYLETGFKGYANFSYMELVAEVSEREYMKEWLQNNTQNG